MMTAVSGPEYAKVVFESQDGGTLWTAAKIHAMCQLEEDAVRSYESFELSCIKTSREPRRCCRSASMGNYVALLTNRSSCFEVVDEDVHQVRNLLLRCSDPFRAYLHLPSHCWDSNDKESTRSQCGSSSIPIYCRHPEEAVYHLLYYIVDRDFTNNDSALSLNKYAISFLPIASGSDAERLYLAIESVRVFGNNLTRIVALDFGLKQRLFDWYLVRDTAWFGVALISVVACVALYARSIFIAIATFFVIAVSLCAAYLVYTFVFGIQFFPFMNLLAALVLVGVGVDDAFVYLEAWQRARVKRDSSTPSRLVENSLRHSTPSAFASSATTAAAFFAGAVASDITVLRCFGVFAGIAVALHFFILAMTQPAVVVIYTRYLSVVCPSKCSELSGCGRINSFPSYIGTFVSLTLPRLVHRFRYLVLSIFGGIGVVAALVIFVYPRLRLPTSSEFQLLGADHPFEMYDLYVKSHFFFAGVSPSRYELGTLPLTVVFGVWPVDGGNQLDPSDKGSTDYDDAFDVGTPESRNFLMAFCRVLRRSPYYLPTQGLQLTDCFVENFNRFMRRGCEDVDGRSLEPCCWSGKSNTTYSTEVFNLCLKEYMPSLLQTSFIYSGGRRDAGLRFDRKTGKPVALVVEFSSTEPFSANYTGVGAFFDHVNELVTNQLSSAPTELRSGFFTSHLAFFNLQRAIASGTPAAIGLAIGASTIVSLLTTVNVLIAIYAMLTVAASICVTVASLVGLGWTLNVVESVTISVAVGLSVDFALHHAVAYRLADPELDRRGRVLTAAGSVASPVAMSALTTFLVGMCLTPSTVLAYRQLGTFLMIVVVASWAYSTFFLQALLGVAGPLNRCGQLTVSPCVCLRRAITSTSDGSTPRPHRIDRTVYATEYSATTSSMTRRNSDDAEQACREPHLLKSSVP